MYVCQSVSKLLSAGSDRCVPDCQGAPRLKSRFFFFFFKPKPSPSPSKLRLRGRRQGWGSDIRGEVTRWWGDGGCHRLSRSDGVRGERLYTPSAVHYFLFHPCKSGGIGQSRVGWGAVGPREKWLPLWAWPLQTLTQSPSPPSTDLSFSALHAERPLWPPPIGAFRLVMTVRTLANGRKAPPPTVF